jgi:hypothetical protein
VKSDVDQVRMMVKSYGEQKRGVEKIYGRETEKKRAQKRD